MIPHRYVSRAMYFVARGRVQIIRKQNQDFLLDEVSDYFDMIGAASNLLRPSSTFFLAAMRALSPWPLSTRP